MRLSHAWQTTRASLIGQMSVIMLLVYFAMIAVALIMLWSLPVIKVANNMDILAGIPAVFWWAFVSSRSLKILRDADKLLLPAAMKTIVISLILQAFVTLVVPAGISALLGGHFVQTLATLFALAAAGLLFMVLPRYIGITMSLLPTVITTLGKHGFIPDANTPDFLNFICLLAAAMVLLALWRFHKLRFYDGDISSWHTPMALLPDAANGWATSGWMKSDDGKMINLGLHFQAAVQPANTITPKLALRTYLGAPFMPLTRSGRIKQFFMLASAYIAIPLFMVAMTTSDSKTDASMFAALAVCWISFTSLGITFTSILLRLQKLYTKDNAELAELALLPGWHNASQARHLLLRVLAEHTGRTLLLPIVIALVAAAMIQSESVSAYFILAAILVTSCLIAAGYGLNIISGRKRYAWLLGGVCIVMFVFSMIQLILSVRTSHYFVMTNGLVGWLVFLSLAALYFWFSWRPLRNLQHPFLRN